MLSVSNAYGGELAYSIGYLGEYSDNIQRDPSNPTREWASSAIAGIGYQENAPEFVARVRAQAQYRDYKYATYTDEALYYVDAAAIWSILPQAFTWSAFDRYDQLTADVTQADTPANRVTVNAFSTGPDVYFHLDRVNTLSLGVRYGNVLYGDGSNDNNRYGGHVRWNYQAGGETVYSLNYLHERVEYTDTLLNDNYRRQDAFVRADWLRNSSQFVVDAGATRIDQEQGPGDEGPTIRLTWNQRLNSETIVTVLLGKEFLDPGMALLATTTEPGQPTTLSLPTPTIPSDGLVDFYYTNRAEITFRHASSRLALEARAFYRDFEYQPQPPTIPPTPSNDRDENGFRIDLAYNPASTFVPGIFFYKTNTSFQDPLRNDHLSDAGVRLLYRSTRQLSTSVEYRRRLQTSTDLLQEYTENSVVLALVYSSNAEIAQANPRQR